MKRFIVKEREHSHGGLFELEVDYYYDVFDTVNQKVVMTFEGGYSADFVGGLWANGVSGGVNKVQISDDDRFVLVFYSGNPEPKKIEIT